MKNFIIETRTNPTDNWKPLKKFEDEIRAKQSLEMRKKHVFNFFKNSNYDLYRLYDAANKKYYY